MAFPSRESDKSLANPNTRSGGVVQPGRPGRAIRRTAAATPLVAAQPAQRGDRGERGQTVVGRASGRTATASTSPITRTTSPPRSPPEPALDRDGGVRDPWRANALAGSAAMSSAANSSVPRLVRRRAGVDGVEHRSVARLTTNSPVASTFRRAVLAAHRRELHDRRLALDTVKKLYGARFAPRRPTASTPTRSDAAPPTRSVRERSDRTHLGGVEDCAHHPTIVAADPPRAPFRCARLPKRRTGAQRPTRVCQSGRRESVHCTSHRRRRRTDPRRGT